MKKSLLLIFVIFLHSFAMASEVEVQLSQNVVSLNESISVDFTITHKIRKQPDFSAIEADFEILTSSQSSQTSIVNQSVSQKSIWHLELMPKREGTLVIPPIQFGKIQSKPVSIEVSAPLPNSSQDNQLYVEAEVTPMDGAFQQSQLIYTIRLCYSVNIAQASLSEVKVNDPDAQIEKLGDDIHYERIENAKKISIVERKYAVFTERSGEIIFSPVVLEAHIVSGTNSFFNAQTRFKKVFSNEVRLTVKPIPAPFQKNDWLAAYDVTLDEEWSENPEKITVGEPITWTLTLKAEGSLASLLPDVSIPASAAYKQYPDKPVLTNTPSTKGNTAKRQSKIALIANKAGTLTLPEITIKWWDLAQNKVRVATVPARTLTVGNAVSNAPIANTTPVTVTEVIPTWAWVLISLNSIWLAGLGIWLYKKTRSKDSSIQAHLKKACFANQAKEAETALLAYSHALSLISLKPHVSPEMQEAIDDLYQALYGKKNSWDGQMLWSAFSTFKPAKAKPTKKL
ncbi:MAG: BatD family protein, partial [Chlamydiales bacterium]|nr:BatD family protein [Chlamydiales bacterium]